MSAIYMIDGKPHELCGCENMSSVCPRGAKRPMQTAGYGQCLVPCQGIVIPLGEPAPQPAQGAASGGETPRTLSMEHAVEILAKNDNFSIVAQNARFHKLTGGRAVCSICLGSHDEIADLLPDWHVCKTCFESARRIEKLQRELAQATAAREGAMEEAALICETKAAVFYQERNFLAQSASVECADAIRSAARKQEVNRG